MSDFNGYVLLHRAIKSWRWYKNPTVKIVFIDLLLSASFCDRDVGNIKLECGQCLTSVDRIHNDTGLSTKQIRLALDKLKSTEEVTIKTTNKFSLVTIVNWASYQSIDENGASKKTNKGQTKDKQRATYNNYKKDKNEKNDIEYVFLGELENVKITLVEFEKAVKKYGEDVVIKKLNDMSFWLEDKPVEKEKNGYARLMKWLAKDCVPLVVKSAEKIKVPPPPTQEEKEYMKKMTQGILFVPEG